MDSIVDHCIEKNENRTKSSQKVSCDIPENIGITDCITRQNIFDCPKWVQSEKCEKLMNFTKVCPQFPMMISGGAKKSKNGTRKGDSKSHTTKSE